MRFAMKQNEQRANDAPPVRPQTAELRVSIAFAERLTCTIAEACEATGLGRTKLYELIGSGDVETATIGRRRLVKVRSLRRLLGMQND
jgi:excisionase family DNA binding protein